MHNEGFATGDAPPNATAAILGVRRSRSPAGGAVLAAAGGAGSAEWAVLGSENQAPRGTGNPGSERIGSHGEAGESRVSLAGHLLPASAGLANLLRAGEGRDGSPERASGRRCSGQHSSERPFGPRGSRRAPLGAGLRGQECWSTLQSGWVPPVSLPTWQFPQVCLAG